MWGWGWGWGGWQVADLRRHNLTLAEALARAEKVRPGPSGFGRRPAGAGEEDQARRPGRAAARVPKGAGPPAPGGSPAGPSRSNHNREGGGRTVV